MKQHDYEKELHEEGFGHIFVWRDEANVIYPDHKHAATTAHIILEGEMTLTAGGQSQNLKAGDRLDVPANAVHSAKIGPQGCKYIVGEK